MKKITAKFNSTCSEAGTKIKKGDQMFYDYSTKKCYSLSSKTSRNFNSDDSNLVNSQEDAFFDNFCYNNNI